MSPLSPAAATTGAAPDSWFSHLAVEVAGEETGAEWLEAVNAEEYSSLKKRRFRAGQARV